ncbi:MAG TPA: hypothetical protein VN649_15180 [Ramlibacter sp.]|nr:hypothetical protein [Ramlibacter sp.]
MLRFIAALLLATAASAALSAQAVEADPLNSSECVAARNELERALSDPAASRQERTERLARARRQAALLCLGREAGGRERSGASEPAQAVPPPVISVRPAPPPRAVASPPPPLIPRAAAITACDAAGCWDSDGRRLNNMGPLLAGPRGLCTVQGGLLNCP